MVGNSSAAATSGAIAGKNAVENNELSGLSGFGSGFWSNTQAQGSLKITLILQMKLAKS